MSFIKSLFCLLILALFLSVSSVSYAASGKDLFQKNCAGCHVNGGNIVNPKFTLHKKDREAHGVRTAADIMNKMRHPGPGMPTFSKEQVPDKDAKKIAEYILKTF